MQPRCVLKPKVSFFPLPTCRPRRGPPKGHYVGPHNVFSHTVCAGGNSAHTEHPANPTLQPALLQVSHLLNTQPLCLRHRLRNLSACSSSCTKILRTQRQVPANTHTCPHAHIPLTREPCRYRRTGRTCLLKFGIRLAASSTRSEL